MSSLRRLIAPVVLALMSTVPLMGQVGTQASIFGAVTDSSGAALPGATATATHLDTGIVRTAVTDPAGNVEILALPIGSYSVTVTLQGFKTWRRDRITLNVGERARVAPVLEVGALTEEISVEGGAPLLQTERSSVQTVIQMEQIRELPLSTRNPVVLVNLVPGMRFTGSGGPERGSTVQGFGMRGNQTEFQLDGLNANAAMDEGGITIPNVDTIEQFSVETSSFSAENGRNPLQIVMATKAGTNVFKGTAWEFIQNDALNARNAFSAAQPAKLDRNQFGATFGGPVMRSRTFFFGSFEATPIRRETIYNSVVPQPAMRQGDFSGLSRRITDPLTGQPFPGNIIPQNRISNASNFFLPYVLQPNSSSGTFSAVAPVTDDTYQYTARVDHQITNGQRIYGRWIMNNNENDSPGYSPEVRSANETTQHNIGFTYTNTLSPTMLLTATAGYLKSDNRFTSPVVGGSNLVEQAGIQGIGTAGREDFVGLPNVGITGYTGFNTAFGVNGRLWSDVTNAKASLTWIRGAHSLSTGYEFNSRSVYGRHGSHSPRGSFDFNGQYTGDGFADYLLGLTSGTRRNFPLETFGLDSSPYSGAYVQDYWKVRSNLTVSLGLRYEYWHAKSLRAGNGATFDPAIGKVVAGVDDDGRVNLSQQPVSPFLAEDSQGLWVPASDVGIPGGLFEANGHLSPRVGITWRPDAIKDFVVRGGYGTYFNGFTGNRSASSIVGLPYWTWEALSYSALTLQNWETAWPSDPQTFIQPSVGESPAWNIDEAKTHEWNVSVQKGLPWNSAVTVSYVATRLKNQVSLYPYNEVAPGRYTNLQAAKPYPAFGEINVLENRGEAEYNGMQIKWERRFVDGLSFTGSYSLSKDISDTVASDETGRIQPFVPSGYLRGRSSNDRRHMLWFNAVYQLPIGRDKRFLSSLHPAADAVLGGWQLSAINSFVSGAPLSISVPGATLGNGWGTRANVSGDPTASDPSASQWFNTSAFSAPPQFEYGNSPIGIVEGPAAHILDLGLMKSFPFGTGRYIQARIEAYNALNKVNLGNPGTSLGSSNFGRILSAGGARTLQFGLKVVF
jgi:Carboxypeptidase regulatory-like domain/TonB dependent receptor/TonB-dependent Receptor Plug Domain